MEIPSLASLLGETSPNLLLRCIAGSQAYGTATATSDTDIRGIFVLPARDYLGLTPPPDQVADERGDTVFYSLRRYVELAAKANPNILEILYSPPDCILFSAPEAEILLRERQLFVTKAAYFTHVEYARSQVKKARGQNKWVHNPQPEEPPRREDFCWFIPRVPSDGALPYRPVRLSESGVDLTRCHAAAVERIGHLYRLYDFGEAARGVIRGGQIVCESIAIEDEASRCIGLLICNEQAYEAARRDHINYWRWRKERNETRWLTQEKGEMDYDAKNLMHTFRLLMSGGHIMRHGEPIVRFSREQLAFLRDVRSGRISYDHLMAKAEQMAEELAALHASSILPEEADPVRVAALLGEITEAWERRHPSLT